MTVNPVKITLEEISYTAFPFVLAMVVALLVRTYVPFLSLWIRKSFGLY